MPKDNFVITSAVRITPGTKEKPGQAVFVDGKTAGRVRLYLVTGFLEFNFEVGPTIMGDLAVTDYQVLSGDCAVSVLS